MMSFIPGCEALREQTGEGMIYHCGYFVPRKLRRNLYCYRPVSFGTFACDISFRFSGHAFVAASSRHDSLEYMAVSNNGFAQIFYLCFCAIVSKAPSDQVAITVRAPESIPSCRNALCHCKGFLS